jgi:hypothetical protein
MFALGANDSGFESQCSDIYMEGLPRQFQRTIENFCCGNCGQEVSGNGYTNHCPACLWSKHVDINPGDRAANCGGLMEPIGLENKSDVFYILQKCQKCDHERRNKAVEGDSFDALIALSTKEKRR